jgi:hypothetical protein
VLARRPQGPSHEGAEDDAPLPDPDPDAGVDAAVLAGLESPFEASLVATGAALSADFLSSPFFFWDAEL